MLQPYECILVGAAMQLPLLWFAVMFLIQLGHWWLAFIEDASPTPNVLMNYAMIYWFGYKINPRPKSDGVLYIKDEDTEDPNYSNGAEAIIVPPTILFFIPVIISIVINYYMIVGILALAVGLTFGVRMLRRLAKIFSKHTNTQHLEK